MSAATDHYRYWAFVSYSSKDTGVARKLHRRLETYRIPRDLVGRPGRDGPVPRRLFPIFRDREELPLSADLGASIEDALAASRYLIVLCSPRSATSRWVNEEIRYFKSLGRDNRILAIILDGEPNASDDPATVEQECFPPALRYRVDPEGRLTDQRTEPIAGDLRPQGDGWTGAFLKAVAGITGLGFDAFARRERKRQRRRRLAGVAVGLLLIAAGLGVWDYNRVKVDHYANVGTRWGVPEGVGPLDARTRAGRDVHYRFESRRYKVRQVLRVNSAGSRQNDDENHGAAVQQVFYREDGTVQQIDLRDHNDRLVVRQTFSELREVEGQATHYVEFRREHQDAPLALAATAGALGPGGAFGGSGRSEITAHESLYDDQGRQARSTYLNAYRQNRPNAGGVFAQAFVYQGSGRLPVRTQNLGFDREPLPDRGGVVFLTVERSGLGDATEAAYFGVDGAPALSRNGYHRVTQAFDERGNVTELAFFGVDGEPALHREGVHRWTRVYDEHGNRIAAAYFDVDGEPALHRDGSHSLTQTFDERGNVTEQARFGVDGEPALHRDGYHRLTQARDERGNVTEQALFGVDGEPVLHRDGTHRLTQTYDERGNVTEQAFFGVDGEPVLHRDGNHRLTQAYDERGNVTERAYFGMDGEATLNRDGYHRVTGAFDERGNITEQAFFGVDGEPALHRDSNHRLTQAFDERGNVTEQAFFGVDDQPVAVSGFVRLEAQYDALGEITGLVGYRADGTSERLR